MVGALRARAEDVLESRPATTFWLGAGAGFVLSGQIGGPLTWRGEVTGLGPLVDERFRVRGQPGLVHDPPPLAGIAGASLGLAFR
jgi:hypothetical protein